MQQGDALSGRGYTREIRKTSSKPWLAMTSKPSKSLTIGVSPTSLHKLKSAAALKGVTVEDFVVKAAVADALRTSSPTEIINLTARGYKRVLQRIDATTALSPALARLMADYEAAKIDGSNTSIAWTPR